MDQLERLMKLISLGNLALAEAAQLLSRLRESKGLTKEELDAKAEKANADARKIIDEL